MQGEFLQISSLKLPEAPESIETPPNLSLSKLTLCSNIELKNDTVIVVLGASGDLAKKKTVRSFTIMACEIAS
jgi:hypothetical protein